MGTTVVEWIGILIFIGVYVAVGAVVAYGVYVLLETLRAVIGVSLRARWIDVVLGIVAGMAVLLVVFGYLRNGPRELFSDSASSVSNAPGP